MELKVIIPSRNRAPQLRLLLQSINRFWPNNYKTELYISWTANEYKAGYDKLFAELKGWHNLYFHETKSPQDNIDNYWSKSEEELLLFITDDSLFYRPCRLTDNVLNNVFENSRILSFGLRNGLNCQIIDWLRPDIKEPPLDYYDNVDFIDWNWQAIKTGHNRYGFSLDGSIIRTKDFAYLSKDVERSNPRQLEGNFNEYARRFSQDRTASFKESCLVNCPMNQVVNAGQLSNGVIYDYSTNVLNSLYLSDITVEFDRLLDDNKDRLGVSVQTELSLRFKRSSRKKWWQFWIKD